ncbi:ACP phosphodiesterase [Spirosoma sp. 209]|uniref:acyl carrier protein phosphodiesterase n=1 Tax=Spirosoma sp. 209 TaxID=1955701 RepID=UPI00098D44A1|nr:ACP phosphodiesterase [Spirosoma sp. 209]
MNILAHAYLSGQDTGLIVGNFIGDFIKGDPAGLRHHLLPGEIAGVRLHRAIDLFTDTHTDVAAVRDILHPRCHKYAGAAVDVFFDHFLAVRFQELTGQSLSAFTTDFYQTLLRHTTNFPATALRMLDAMIRYDWLTHYQTLDGINRSLTGISRRTAFPSGLETAVEDLQTYYVEIETRFMHYWPQLTAEVGRVKRQLAETT